MKKGDNRIGWRREKTGEASVQEEKEEKEISK